MILISIYFVFILLRKGFRDTNNLITDTFLKHWRNLKNTVVSKTLIPGLYFDDFKLWTVIQLFIPLSIDYF